MPITASDYQLIDKWKVGSIDIINIYYVRHVAGLQTALECINAFDLEMGPKISDILNALAVQDSTEAFSLTDPTDFAQKAGTNVGNGLTESLPTFVAVNFPLLRPSRDFRNSAKRYGPVSEADIAGNSIAPGAVARFDAVAASLMATWVGGSGSYELVIPKRTLISGSYVLSDLARPAGAGTYRVSSQNSRKT